MTHTFSHGLQRQRRRQRQAGLSEFKASLGYKGSSRTTQRRPISGKTKAKNQNPVQALVSEHCAHSCTWPTPFPQALPLPVSETVKPASQDPVQTQPPTPGKLTRGSRSPAPPLLWLCPTGDPSWAPTNQEALLPSKKPHIKT